MKNKSFLLLFALPLLSLFLGSTPVKKHKLEIKIIDSLSKDIIDYVNVHLKNDSVNKFDFTDSKGQVIFEIPSGEYLLNISFVGFQAKQIELMISKDTSILVSLSEVLTHLDELVIKDSGRRRKARSIAPARMVESHFKISKLRSTKESASPVGEGVSAPDDGYDISSGAIKSGTLTAGEINDFAKWVLWEDLEKKDFEIYKKKWSLSLNKRFSVQVMFPNYLPVVDAEVVLVNDKNEIEFKARTDNSGKAELWANLESNPQYIPSKNYHAYVVYQERKEKISKLQEAPVELNRIVLEIPCEVSNTVDIAFVVDATGSMGDEINYLKLELKDVLERVKTTNSSLKMNTASVFYRDHTDEYIVRKSEFSSDISQTLEFIRNQSAFGGGDFPEAVDAALETAINDLKWSKNARARLLFLVLDAPPHGDSAVIKQLQKLIYKAAAMGIRIIPVTGSGIDKSVEYLMRSMALATNGTYTFLTDDSGVGGSHIAPSTDSYKVEKLNDLLVRLINQYFESTGCNYSPQIPKDSSQAQLPKDSSLADSLVKLSLNCYPIPTQGLLNIEVNKAGGAGFVCDVNGKYVMRFEMKEVKKVQQELGQLASGTYFIRYQYKDEWQSRKIILQH